MKLLIVIVVLVVSLQGCSIFETSSGKSRYSVSPVILTGPDGTELAACCELLVFNSKDIGAVTAHGEYDPETGKIVFSLRQEMVDASSPTKVAMENQAKMADMLTQILKIVKPL